MSRGREDRARSPDHLFALGTTGFGLSDVLREMGEFLKISQNTEYEM